MHNPSSHTEVHPDYNRIEYKDQLKSITKAQKDNDKNYKKKTSGGRRRAANDMMAGGVTNDQAERHNNWDGPQTCTMER